MYTKTRKAHRKRVENRLRISHSHRISSLPGTQKPKRIPRFPKFTGAESALLRNQFLSIRLDPIPYMRLKAPQFADDLGDILKLKAVVGWLAADLSEDDIPMLGLQMAKRFSDIAEATGFDWTVAEINDNPREVVLVFYYSFRPTGSWLAPQLSFLPIIKRRSARMHEAILSSLQHISKALGIGKFTSATECIEWTIEQLDEDAYEFEDTIERDRAWKSVQSHTDGKAAKALREVTSGTPILSPVQCIERLYKLPEDLHDLKTALIDLLCLSDRGADLSDFDINQAGLNRLDLMDNIYLTLDYQYAWIYEEGPVTANAEEYLDSLSNEGQQEPTTWMIIGESFGFPQDRDGLLNRLQSLKRNDFPDRFIDSMKSLCEAIVELKERKK